MSILELLALLRAAGEVTAYAEGLLTRLHNGTDPTPEELADVKAKQAAAEQAWAAGLEQRKGDE